MQINLSDLTNRLVEVEDKLRSLEAERQQIIQLFREHGSQAKNQQIAELAKRAELQKPIEPPNKEPDNGTRTVERTADKRPDIVKA